MAEVGDGRGGTSASLSHFAALRVIGGAGSLVSLGVACFSLGDLIFRSSYRPRTIGVLLAVAGLAI